MNPTPRWRAAAATSRVNPVQQLAHHASPLARRRRCCRQHQGTCRHTHRATSTCTTSPTLESWHQPVPWGRRHRYLSIIGTCTVIRDPAVSCPSSEARAATRWQHVVRRSLLCGRAIACIAMTARLQSAKRFTPALTVDAARGPVTSCQSCTRSCGGCALSARPRPAPLATAAGWDRPTRAFRRGGCCAAAACCWCLAVACRPPRRPATPAGGRHARRCSSGRCSLTQASRSAALPSRCRCCGMKNLHRAGQRSGWQGTCDTATHNMPCPSTLRRVCFIGVGQKGWHRSWLSGGGLEKVTAPHQMFELHMRSPGSHGAVPIMDDPEATFSYTTHSEDVTAVVELSLQK
mmetsp:Transcript_75514/g.166808  ORF Transcript_75514/g.166808 Transcript_75514/m.166808 type:complete len:348 (+) Transcript_75514:355-1398(+)